MSVTINHACSACGNKKFHQPINPNPNDNIVCTGCGAKTTYRAFQHNAEQQKQQIAKDMAKAIARKLGN